MPPLNMKYYVHSGHYWILKVIAFQPSARQKFIQQLNTRNMEDVDQLRWPLCSRYRSDIFH